MVEELTSAISHSFCTEAQEMERVVDELDKVKAAMEQLKEEFRMKTELSDGLRKVHNELVIKYQEAKLLTEKQAQELNNKSQGLSELKQLYEDLKSILQEKESFVKQLDATNEELRGGYGKRVQKLVGQNKELLLALDEATLGRSDLEKQIAASNEDIEGLKRLVSISQKKCIEAEKEAKASKELKQRDDIILKLEEENSTAKDQLKWKNEQFAYLEEAHRKLQDQFRLDKVEWEKEKSALIEENFSLQASLDSQTRMAESFQNQLRICNQALTHEENRRKVLEVEVSEFRSRFDNVLLDYQEATTKFEHLTVKKDEEIADLSYSLKTKETLSKEKEYRIARLEQENQELRGSLKEFQDAQITDSISTSSLKTKIQNLQQLNGKQTRKLKEKEAAWISQMENITKEMNCCTSELKDKDKQIKQLRKELDGNNCFLEVHDEAISMAIMLLKSEFTAAYTKLVGEKVEMELWNKEREEKIMYLTKQLEITKGELCENLEFQEEALFHSKQAEKLAALLDAKELELEKQKDLFRNERSCLEIKVKEHESEKGALLEDIKKQASQREDLLVQIEGICKWIGEFSGKDAQLMGILEKMLQNSEKETALAMNLIASGEHAALSFRKEIEERVDRRSPLRELNH